MNLYNGNLIKYQLLWKIILMVNNNSKNRNK